MKEVQREIHTIDAAGLTPGRLATRVAGLLMGKGKTAFQKNVDGGDHVQIINASKMSVRAKKMEQKIYYHHTSYAKGLREKSMKKVWSENPGEVLVRAVSRMLPKNSHRNERMKRLVVKN